MTTLTHQLDRTIAIGAPPASVFRYFTDSPRWAAWWGEGSTIDARPGGAVLIRYPGGVEVAGEVVEVNPPDRIVFSYGFVSGKPIPPGSSLVTIRLEPAGRGTRLHLVHQFAEAAVRDEHVQGWRYQLSVFANVVANEIHADPAALVDAWFAAWNETDEKARATGLAAIASDSVSLRDRFSCVQGTRELTLHIGASQRFMPGLPPAARRRRASLPGHHARRVGRVRSRRPAARARHERVHGGSRRPDRIGNGFLELGTGRPR